MSKKTCLTFLGAKRQEIAKALAEEARQRNMSNGGCLKWSDIAWECFVSGFQAMVDNNAEIEERESK